jgi:hypothetical protein
MRQWIADKCSPTRLERRDLDAPSSRTSTMRLDASSSAGAGAASLSGRTGEEQPRRDHNGKERTMKHLLTKTAILLNGHWDKDRGRRVGTCGVLLAVVAVPSMALGSVDAGAALWRTDAIPQQLVGTWIRTVTKADVKRTGASGIPSGSRCTLTVRKSAKSPRELYGSWPRIRRSDRSHWQESSQSRDRTVLPGRLPVACL